MVKILEKIIHTANVGLLFLMTGVAMGLAKEYPEQIQFVSFIWAIWLAGFLLAILPSVFMPESFSNLKNEQISRLRLWKTLTAKSFNLLSLIIWVWGASHDITTFAAIGFTLLAGFFSGYTYTLETRRVLFKVVEVLAQRISQQKEMPEISRLIEENKLEQDDRLHKEDIKEGLSSYIL